MNKSLKKIKKIKKDNFCLSEEYIEQKRLEKYNKNLEKYLEEYNKSSETLKMKLKLNTIKNMKNNNNVILPVDIFESALIDYNTKVVSGKAFGEIFDVKACHAGTNLKDISHKIESIKIRNWFFFKEYICEIKILDTPQGKIAKELLKNKVKFDLHVTANGSYDNRNYISKDYKILRIDLWINDKENIMVGRN